MTLLYSPHLRKLLVPICFLLTASVPLQAQPLLTLEEVVQTVLNNNLAIQMARNDQKIAAKRGQLVYTDFFPALGLKSGAHRQLWPDAPAPNTVSAGFGAEWKVGLHSVFAYQQLRTQSQISQLEAQQTIANKVAEAIKAYYDLVFAQKKKQVLARNIAVSKEVLQLAQAKYEVGEATQLDYLSAQVEYNEEQTTLLLQEEAITAAQLTLCGLLGRNTSGDFTTIEDIPLPEQLSWEALSAALKATNPRLLMSQKRCEEAQASLRAHKAWLLPQLGFSLDYTREGKYQASAWATEPGAWRGSIGLTWNLAQVFQYPSTIQQARIRANNGKLGVAATQVQLEATLKQQFLHYTQQLQRYALAQQHVQVGQESATVALEQYRLGSITLLVLEQARKTAQETTLRCLEAIYEAKVAEIALQQLTGGLLDNYKF